jgi:choline dehydrogenase-like flavoprotein
LIVDAGGPGRAAFGRAFDVCVVGAGPAGVTLALRLAARGLDVALMEAGGRDFSTESQEIYAGESVGREYWPLDVPRLRFLGGSTNHWGGWCRPLDALDFEAKPWNPLSGWPFGKAELDPYAAETEAILEIPSAAEAPDDPVAAARDGFREVRFRFSDPPMNVRDRFAPELEAAARITTGLQANLVALRLEGEGGRRVAAARFRGYGDGDPGFEVEARAVVLACGGIETARLLLNFDRAEGGLGDASGLIGRCFAEHPHYVLGEGIFRRPLPRLSFFSPTEAFLREHETLNFGLRIERTPEPFVRQPGTVAGDPSCADPFILRLAERVADVAPACGPGGDGRIAFDGLIRIAYEQAVNPDSRVLLAAEVDRFGLARPALDWRLSPLDVHTLRRSLMAFAVMLAERDIGRVRIRDWVMEDPLVWPGIADDEVGGKHHMGTTRMADDPRRGVVDRHGRMHGLANLYVAGSGVFPTGGHANPTYTVVQLALRLGDHLGATLGG